MTCLAERLGKYRERETEGSKFIIWPERVKVKRNGMKFENTLFGQLIYTENVKTSTEKSLRHFIPSPELRHLIPHRSTDDDVAHLPLTF